jgi:hypothetical protein
MASIPVPPPIGVDLVGFMRRHEPMRGYGQPLEVNALVLDDGERRIALVGLDLVAIAGQYALDLRAAIGRAAGCERANVFVNYQHTHAAPPPAGAQKWGGRVHDLTRAELGYWDQLVGAAASAAAVAASRLVPARVGTATSTLDGLSVNRRERLDDGRTILGWNPDAACDRTVAVLRIEGIDRSPIGTVVCFACHPVVIGPDVPECSSDFVGPMREAVRRWTGGDCLFLQGCAGNILPLECFLEAPSPEVEFGRRLALAALAAHAAADPMPRRLVRTEYRSAVPIARYRWTRDGEEYDGRVDAIEQTIALPLDEPPSLEEITALRQEMEAQVRDLQVRGAGPEQWIPIEIESLWAADIECRVREGKAERSVDAPVQALRIGRVGIVGLPGEPFTELGLLVKERSPAAFTICCGYTNDNIGYFPTAEEHAHGGMEVATNHRHQGHPAPLSVGCDHLLIETAARLLRELFDGS